MIAYEIGTAADFELDLHNQNIQLHLTLHINVLGNSDLTKLLLGNRFEGPGVAGVSSSSIERNLKQR